MHQPTVFSSLLLQKRLGRESGTQQRENGSPVDRECGEDERRQGLVHALTEEEQLAQRIGEGPFVLEDVRDQERHTDETDQIHNREQQQVDVGGRLDGVFERAASVRVGKGAARQLTGHREHDPHVAQKAGEGQAGVQADNHQQRSIQRLQSADDGLLDGHVHCRAGNY